MRLVRFRKAWAAVWWEDGKRFRRSLGPGSPLEAQAAFDAFRKLRASQAPPITVGQLWDAYRATIEGRPAHVTMGHEWKALGPHFRDRLATLITENECRSYASARAAQGRADGTVWTELGRLRRVLTWAAQKGLIDKAPHIWRPKPGAPRDRRLTREEFAAFLDAVEFPHLRLFAILAISTAGRSEALLELTWDRVDFDRGLIHLGDPDERKRQKGRATVPMTNAARAALSEAYEARLCSHVIEWAGQPVASVKKGIKAAAKRAGVVATPHVFRHSAACWMAEAGVQMSEIAAYLGHSDDRVTQRHYAKYSPSYLRGASVALEMGNAGSKVLHRRVR